MSRIEKIKKDLRRLADPAKAKLYARFFKTGSGEYGEGDIFLGITVPKQRAVALQFLDVSLPDLSRLLKSPIHEHRFTALEILVAKFEQGDGATQKKIYYFYFRQTRFINNWDLVDTTAPYIVGAYLLHQPRGILIRLGKSKNLWERRIAIVSTYSLIKAGQFDDALRLCRLLINDQHDLIHKACGWMLREVGKKNQKVLEKFLNHNAGKMPRTMLRYAIERLPVNRRQHYLQKY